MPQPDRIILTGLEIPCIIGIFEWERRKKQKVMIDMEIPADIRRAARNDDIRDAADYKRISKAILSFVETSRFQLVETLAERLADLLLSRFGLAWVTLRVSKPGAIRGSRNVGVEIHRSREAGTEERVYFSLGSNMEPALHLGRAVLGLDRKYGLKAVSHVYETSPVGGAKVQPDYWNLVASVATDESPDRIRRWTAGLEKKAGRKKTKDRYGPRPLDIDLILWKNRIFNSKTHPLPHPDIRAKAFVLFPLLEIAPTLSMPDNGNSLMEQAAKFSDKSQNIHRLPWAVLERPPGWIKNA